MEHNYDRRIPKSLTQLIGADYQLLKNCGSNVVTTFYWAAFFLVVVVVITFLSVWEAMNLLFHLLHVELLLSLFFSLLFLLMYIFLLNTFSKNDVRTRNNMYSTSNLTRVGFIIFMAFILSKPLEIKILTHFVETETEQYKATLLQNYKRQLNDLIKNDAWKLENRKHYLLSQQRVYPSEAITEEITAIEQQETILKDQQAQHIALATNKVAASDFFVHKIKIVTHSIRGWLIFLPMLALFLLPGFLIYSIASDNTYYTVKKEQEQQLIVNSYNQFLQEYSKLGVLYGLKNLQYYTVFADPPFNTMRKPDNKYGSQKDFLTSFFNRD